MQAFATEYESALEEALRGSHGGSDAISQAISTVLSQRALFPFTDGDTAANGTFAASYAKGLVQTSMRGLSAHGYALTYAGHTYTGSTADEAARRADTYAAAFALSESACVLGYRCEHSQCIDGRCSDPMNYDLEDRFTYARAYERGYAEALHRVEQGITRESAIQNWASVYAQSYVHTHTYRDIGFRDGIAIRIVNESHACLQGQSGNVDFNFAYERRRYNLASIPAQDWSALDLAHTCASLLAYAAIDLGMTHNPELHASAYYQGARHVSELGLNGQEADDYTFDYYLAYYETRHGRKWDFFERAHIYAVTYADIKKVGLPNEEGRIYAGAY